MMRVVKEESHRLHLEIEENIDAERYTNNGVLGCPSRSYQMDSAPNDLLLDVNFGTSLEFDGIHCEFWKWLESFVYPRVVWPMCRASILLRAIKKSSCYKQAGRHIPEANTSHAA